MAYEHIKQQLLNGRFHQGDSLPVEQFALELDMSRQPVMEAMKRLAEHGFVEIIPQVGCRVAVLDAHEIADLFRYLALTEGLLAELAAERWRPEQMVRLRAASRAIGDLVTSGVTGEEGAIRFRVLNDQFHRIVADMASAEVISRAARSMTERSDFHIATSAPDPFLAQRLELSHREHEEAVHRIERRQGKLAGQAMADHVLGFYVRTFRDIAA